MTYRIATTSRFRKEYKLMKKRGRDMSQLKYVVEKLSTGQVLEEKYKDHSLTGNYAGYRECHIAPDWLLIYYIQQNMLVLTLSRTGSHSDLF